MAFHVACPITCKRICFCTLGFPRPLQSEASRGGFLDDVRRVEGFVAEDWIVKVRRTSTIQVTVPRVAPPPPAPSSTAAGESPGSDGEEALRSAQRKRATMQRKAAAALVVAEDYARRFETGLTDASQDLAGVKQGLLTVNVMCRLCFSGGNEGSERARRMLSCKCCGKKYHRNCLKVWAHHRDLFHWSSWKCPSCRICEVCRRTGDPNKFMFCKRCDGAYHCYCQQPPHKNASSGPYLCPKHTKCHSCGSSVPGNGLSTRWFLGYTCCDACGRLFVKRNYCPVCLKVYRDSESTPMVCCDDCQRWVHCQCDGISDERYLQFQVDNNLPYKCPTCRGESYEAKDLEDTVQELWRRRDEADKDLIASLRAAAGLPTQDEIFSISPYSDDDNGPVMLKNDYSRSLKFSLKGFVEKSRKKNKELGKKSSKKKNLKDKGSQALLVSKTDAYQCLEGQIDAGSSEHSLGDDKNDELMSHIREGTNVFSSPVAGSLGLTEGICSVNQPGVLRHKFVDEIVGSTEDKKPRVVKIKNSKLQNLDVTKNIGKHAVKSKIMKGPKLVIHLGGVRNRNLTDSSMSDGSSCQREQELATSNGSENTSQQRTNDNFNADRLVGLGKFDHGGGGQVDSLLSSNERGSEGDFIKVGVSKPEFPDYTDTKFSRGNSMDGPSIEAPALRTDEVPLGKHPAGMPDISSEGNDDPSKKYSASKLAKDSKPLLKLKFKNPYFENQSSWASYPAEEKSFIKGQRSKRKRPPYMEKTSFVDDEHLQGNSMSETVDDANWILKTLGKDAIGKRVEVHLPSDNSWHKGGVIDINETASAMTVDLDDGRVKSMELGKHGIRLISQKHKWAKA